MSDPDAVTHCQHCGYAGLDVELEGEVRGSCPKCGKSLVPSLRMCALPNCEGIVSTLRPLPVCQACGIKIAVLHANDATLWHAVQAEGRREREAAQHVRQNGRPGEALVYYVRLDEDRIKIGFTSKLRDRLRGLRVHPSALLAIEPGGRDVEKARHEQFATERLSRFEDFAPTQRLLDWIAERRAEHDLPHWAKLPDTRVVRRSA